MRLYIACCITNITSGVAIVGINVRLYLANVATIVTSGITSIVILVSRYTGNITALLTYEPVVLSIVSVGRCIRMRLYRALYITYVTSGITVIGIYVRLYSANLTAIVTGGVAIVGINVNCNVLSLLTYCALVPVCIVIVGVGALIGMVCYVTKIAANVTGRIAGVIVYMSYFILSNVTYRTLIPVSIVVRKKLVCVLDRTLLITNVTNGIAIVIVNVIGYFTNSFTNVTGGVASVGIFVSRLALLYTALGTLVPMLIGISVRLVCVGMARRTLLAAVVTIGVTTVIISVTACIYCVTTFGTFIPVLCIVTHSQHVIMLCRTGEVTNVTSGVTRIVEGMCDLALGCACVTSSIAIVIVNVCAYLTDLTAYITVRITDVEEYVSTYLTGSTAKVTGSVTYVVIGVRNRTNLTANVTIRIARIEIRVLRNVASFILVVTNCFVPVALRIRGPLGRILVVM